MGSRRLHGHKQEHDHLLDAPTRADGGEHADPKPETVTDHLLKMQRTYGNAAVGVTVQRRERPQSTDAPGKKQPPKKETPAEDHSPKESNPQFSSWSNSDLMNRASRELDSTVRNSWYFAAELYEELWFRQKGKAYAVGPYRAYKKLGDAKREKFWEGVMNGTITPGAKKGS